MYDKPISYSGKSLYKKCPRKWHDAYILGNREPPHPKAERGTALHLELENYFRDKTPYPTASKVLAPWQGYMSTIYDLGKIYSGEAEGEIACDSNWKPLAYDDPKAHARGKKDYSLFRPTDSVLRIWDWKSGKIYPEHKLQGQYYAAISPDADLVVPEFAYLDIPLHTEASEYTRSQVDEIRKELDDEIAIIRMDNEWRPNPGDECRWCKKNWRAGGDCTAAP